MKSTSQKPYACRNCRHVLQWVEGVGWLHTELPQYAREDITCQRAHPVCMYSTCDHIDGPDPDCACTTPVTACKGCGRTKSGPTGDPTDLFPSEHCGDCPPWACEDCGEPCSADALCSCWVPLEGLAFADIKAVLADAGLSVGLPQEECPGGCA